MAIRKFLVILLTALLTALSVVVMPSTAANAAITTTYTGYGLHEVVRYTGKYQASTAGFSGGNTANDTNANGNGNFAVLKPAAGATVVKAFLSSAAVYWNGSAYVEAARPPVTSLSGQTVNFYAKNYASPFTNYLADVTTIVQGFFSGSPTGTAATLPWSGTKFSIPITYEAAQYQLGIPTYSHGLALTVIFQNTSMTSDASVVYYFGSSNSAGQTFALNFDALPALSGGAAYSGSWLSLGISWSQGGGQYSTIKVQNNVQAATAGSPWTNISGSAGGCDDSFGPDGTSANPGCDPQHGLVTVGGVGDSVANPASIGQGVADDELYNLDSVLAAGVNSINLNSTNPSGDDNIFQAVLSVPFILSGTAVFNNNTGSGTMANQVSLTSAQLTANTFTKNSWTFVGWNTLADGSGTAYADQAVYPFTTDIILYAQWSQNTRTVTYDTQGGSAVSSTNYTGTITSFPASPTKPNATFNGWFIAASGGSALATPYTPASFANITIYAQWTSNAPPPAPTFLATFDSQGGSAINSIYFNYSFTVPAAPIREGFNFAGWFTEAKSGFAVSGSYQPSPLSNVTLYAHWVQKVYVVKYNTQGGEIIADATFTDKISLPLNVRRAGHKFVGWTLSASTSTKIPGGTYSPSTLSDITVYAQWVKAAALTVVGFKDGSASLSSEMLSRIKTFAKVHPKFNTIECNGFTEGPSVLRGDRQLARQRGIAVCSALQNIYGKRFISENIKSINLTVVSSSNRKATILLSLE